MVCYYHLFNSFPVHCDPDSQMLSHSWVIKKARELKKKKISLCFIDYTKAFDCGSQDKGDLNTSTVIPGQSI